MADRELTWRDGHPDIFIRLECMDCDWYLSCKSASVYVCNGFEPTRQLMNDSRIGMRDGDCRDASDLALHELCFEDS